MSQKTLNTREFLLHLLPLLVASAGSKARVQNDTRKREKNINLGTATLDLVFGTESNAALTQHNFVRF